MTNKDVFKILLCSYGYDRNIKIETYRGDEGFIGYDVYAENKEGDSYHEVDCEGFMFHVYEILKYMDEKKVGFKSGWWNFPLKHFLNDDLRNSTIVEWDKKDNEVQESIIRMQPLEEWKKKNNPCPTCTINKKDHWDIVHYKCELCHTHNCNIMTKFWADFQIRTDEFMKNLKK